MNKSDVEYLYSYDRWANARILDAVSGLTEEQFTMDMKSSHGSIRDTLSHILAAEWIWLERWNGVSPQALLNPSAFPTVDALRERWSEVDRGYKEFIERVTDASLDTVITYTNTKGEKWSYPLVQMLQHVMNHSSYHRGQVVTMLRQLGENGVTVDLLIFMDVGGK
jgi:uncharacterized damage-inducible protein DinB